MDDKEKKIEIEQSNELEGMEEQVIEHSEVPEEEQVAPAQSEVEASIIPGISKAQFNQLSSKNKTFLVNVDKQLGNQLGRDILTRVYHEIVETLVDGQHQSLTARQIYGTPTETVDTILAQEFADESEPERSPDWQIALDGGLLLGSIYTIIIGLVLMRGRASAEATNYMGLITIIINYLVAGVAMLFTSRALPNFDAENKKDRGILRYFLVSTLAWFFVVTLSGILLPSWMNPTLAPEVYLLIGVITIVARYFVKRHYNIKGSVF